VVIGVPSAAAPAAPAAPATTAAPATPTTATPTAATPTAPVGSAPAATDTNVAAAGTAAAQPAATTTAPTSLPSAPDTGVAAATAAGSNASSGGHTSTAKDGSNGDSAAGNPAPGPAPAAGSAAPVATPQSAPVTAPAPSAAPAATAATAPTAYGVRLAEAAEKVSDTIAMGARDGISMARIELSPESLGAIQIHLQHTPDGLVARVVTEHPEAAQTLSQGSDDLKRQLQQNGATLLRLDIESSGQQRSGRDGQAGSTSGPDDNDPARPGTGSADEDADAQTAADTPLQTLSGSALVNVLA
jgi:flagellar hook-length control protein FliK